MQRDLQQRFKSLFLQHTPESPSDDHTFHFQLLLISSINKSMIDICGTCFNNIRYIPNCIHASDGYENVIFTA